LILGVAVRICWEYSAEFGVWDGFATVLQGYPANRLFVP
jgi:hypothetical protein